MRVVAQDNDAVTSMPAAHRDAEWHRWCLPVHTCP